MVTSGENVLGFSWVGLTQEIDNVLRKHCLTTNRWQLFFLPFEAFFALPTHPVFHVHRTVCRRFVFRALSLHQCQRTALLHSVTGVCSGRCGVGEQSASRSLELHVRKVATSRAILLQPVPSKLFMKVVLFVSHNKMHLLAPSTTHAVDIQHDTFTEPDTFHYNFTFFTVFYF